MLDPKYLEWLKLSGKHALVLLLISSVLLFWLRGTNKYTRSSGCQRSCKAVAWCCLASIPFDNSSRINLPRLQMDQEKKE